MKALAIGGTTDHIHALLSLPATMSFAKAVQLIKGGSSKWIHDTFAKYKKFEWQEGYGAFSVSASQVDRTIAYHQQSERASSEANIRRRVHRAVGQARHRLRSALSIPMNESAKRTIENSPPIYGWVTM